MVMNYGNEREVGQGIQQAIQAGLVKRKNLFVSSKLWVADVNANQAKQAINASLKRLGLDYLDLLLIHQPYNDVFGAWRAMEEAYRMGKLKAIGVSNFAIDQITNLAEFSDIKPMVDQIEVNPFCQNVSLLDYLFQYGIQPQAWAPFAEGRNSLFTNPALTKIAQNHHKSVAQVVLRLVIQQGVIPLVKSVKPSRMKENLGEFDFALTPAEMDSIRGLDQHHSQFFNHHDPDKIKWMAHRDIKY